MKKYFLILLIVLLMGMGLCCCTAPSPEENSTKSNSITEQTEQIDKTESNKDQADKHELKKEITKEKVPDNIISTEAEPKKDDAISENIKKNDIKEELKTEQNPLQKNIIPKSEDTQQAETVRISVTCVDKSIVSSVNVEINDNKNVFDILKQITRDKKIHMDFTGAGKTIYIRGIDNIYEFDMGAESGWMYSVNGIFPSVSCGDYFIKPGDDIKWLYTKDLGKDLGSSFE